MRIRTFPHRHVISGFLVVGALMSQQRLAHAISAITPTQITSFSSTATNYLPQSLAVNFDSSYHSCGGIPQSYVVGSGQFARTYSSNNVLTLTSSDSSYNLSEWFEGTSGGYQTPTINGSGSTPALTEVTSNLQNSNFYDGLLGFDASNTAWVGVYSGSCSSNFAPGDWSWTSVGAIGAFGAGVAYGPSISVQGSALSGGYILASDVAGNCNSDGDSYVNVNYDDEWYQQTATSGTLCSRFVQVDWTTSTFHYYTLQNNGQIWAFTPYAGSSKTSSTLGTEVAAVSGAGAFATAGDASGYAATTFSGTDASFGTNGSSRVRLFTDGRNPQQGHSLDPPQSWLRGRQGVRSLGVFIT